MSVATMLDATTLRCVGAFDADLADALVIELVAAVRDERRTVVVDLRHASPVSFDQSGRLVGAVAAARARGLDVIVVARPGAWFVPLAAAGYDDVLVASPPETRNGIVLVGRRAA